jgi:hypothetical protein
MPTEGPAQNAFLTRSLQPSVPSSCLKVLRADVEGGPLLEALGRALAVRADAGVVLPKRLPAQDVHGSCAAAESGASGRQRRQGPMSNAARRAACPVPRAGTHSQLGAALVEVHRGRRALLLLVRLQPIDAELRGAAAGSARDGGLGHALLTGQLLHRRLHASSAPTWCMYTCFAQRSRLDISSRRMVPEGPVLAACAKKRLDSCTSL